MILTDFRVGIVSIGIVIGSYTLALRTAVPECSGHGTEDDNGSCECYYGYKGENCENETHCGSYGEIQSDETCKCKPYWKGPTCRTIICLDRGIPYRDGKKCRCRSGIIGWHCEGCLNSTMGCRNCTEFSDGLPIWKLHNIAWVLVIIAIFVTFCITLRYIFPCCVMINENRMCCGQDGAHIANAQMQPLQPPNLGNASAP